jgi:hypothetical protein
MFDQRLFAALFFGFIVATVVGTLSHELGHYLTARLQGYEASLSFAYTHIAIPSPAPDASRTAHDYFLFTCAGPLQTLLTGTIGSLLLILNRRSIQAADKLSPGQWILVFLSLFWLREPANLAMLICKYIMTGEIPGEGDEIEIARYLDLPAVSILISCALIGLIICVVVVFRFIPYKQRLTFLLAAFTGSLTGYVFWLMLFGKYILP